MRGSVTIDDVAVVALDRGEGKNWGQTCSINKVPTLTCANRYLFLLSLHDLEAADNLRQYFRFLQPTERLILQGFHASVASNLKDPALVIKATGNAYPVPLVIAATHGMLRAIADSTLDLATWPPPCMPDDVRASPDADEVMRRVDKDLKDPPRRQESHMTSWSFGFDF